MAKYKPFACHAGISPQIHLDEKGRPYAVLMRAEWAGVGDSQTVSVEVIKLEREDAEAPTKKK